MINRYCTLLFLLTSLFSFSQIQEQHSVYFDVDKDEFSFSEGRQLNAFFDNLLYKPILDVKILGYCDDRGSYEYNMDLSNRRVETVTNWLQNHDIQTDHISKIIEGRGEVALEKNSQESLENERAQNRRVDLTFTLRKEYVDRIEIKQLERSKLTQKQKEFIDEYEEKVVDKIINEPDSKESIPVLPLNNSIDKEDEITAVKVNKNTKAATTAANTPEEQDEYLDIPTKLDPPIDNTKEPFKSLLRKNIKKGEIIRLENVLFYKGRSKLIEESQPILERIAEILLARQDIEFEIHGHVCCINPAYKDAYNRDTKKTNLSVDRAKTIFKKLRERGIDPRRMKFKGFGRTKPLGGPDKNDRRVELYITKINK